MRCEGESKEQAARLAVDQALALLAGTSSMSRQDAINHLQHGGALAGQRWHLTIRTRESIRAAASVISVAPLETTHDHVRAEHRKLLGNGTCARDGPKCFEQFVLVGVGEVSRSAPPRVAGL